MRRLYSIAFILLSSLVFWKEAPAQQLFFQKYTVHDGLVTNPVRSIFQDSKGFIWIATWEGLSKFDGYKFSNFSTANGLSHNLINDLYESREGNLYIAENNGSVDMMAPNGIIRKEVFKKSPIDHFLRTRNNRVIAVTDMDGYYEMKNNVFVKIPQPLPYDSCSAITDVSDSVFAVILNDHTLKVFDKNYHPFTKLKTLHDVQCIFGDSQHRLWVGTSYGLRLVSVSALARELTLLSLPEAFDIPLLKNSIIMDILEDTDGSFWIATRSGLVKVQPGSAPRIFSEKDGLPSADVSCVFRDREKNIWAGTSLGLAKFASTIDLQIYTKADGLASDLVAGIFPLPTGKIMVFTDHCQLLDPVQNSFTSIAAPNSGFTRAWIRGTQPPLFLSIAGLEEYDMTTQTIRKIVPFTEKEGAYCAGGKDDLIFIGRDSLAAMRAGRQLFISNNGKTGNPVPYRISVLLTGKNDNTLWIGTWENGLYFAQYTVKDDSLYISVKDLSYLLTDHRIRSLFEDSKGNLWAGTRYAGVFCLHNEGKEYRVEHFQKEQGLGSDWVRAIAEDQQENIWIGSLTGIDKITREGNKSQIVNFSRFNNFFAGIGSIIVTADNSIWCSGVNGLAHFTDNHLEKNAALPVYITTAVMGTGREKINALQSDKKISLHYNQNQAQFEFSAPGFINEKEIQYSYRLKGGDDTSWSIPSGTHSVSYASLQPGNYNFEVRSIGWDNTPGAITAFNFIVRPPFWKTWWFYTASLLLLCLLFLMLYHYRVNQLLKLQKVRNNIATDLHDDIGTSLTNIAILSELSNKNIANPAQAKVFMQRISEEVNSSGQALDDIVWSINSHNDTLEQTLARMLRYAAEVFDASDIVYSLEMNEKFASHRLGMEQRRDLFLIFKECINNIHKHAQAKKVQVKMGIEKNRLWLSITDDGKGFDSSQSTHRNGLKNIRHRVGKWKGELDIRSAPGEGSTLRFYLPVAWFTLK